MTITKRSAKDALAIPTDSELARLLGITKQAVSQMQDDEPLPEGRQWQLRALHPDVFGQPEAQANAA